MSLVEQHLARTPNPLTQAGKLVEIIAPVNQALDVVRDMLVSLSTEDETPVKEISAVDAALPKSSYCDGRLQAIEEVLEQSLAAQKNAVTAFQRAFENLSDVEEQQLNAVLEESTDIPVDDVDMLKRQMEQNPDLISKISTDLGNVLEELAFENRTPATKQSGFIKTADAMSHAEGQLDIAQKLLQTMLPTLARETVGNIGVIKGAFFGFHSESDLYDVQSRQRLDAKFDEKRPLGKTSLEDFLQAVDVSHQAAFEVQNKISLQNSR